MRIGSDEIVDVDVRVIAATNANLEEKINKGLFRADLFYRLNVINLNVSPLRNRKEDIHPLLKHFLGKSFALLSNWQKELLENYDWPGNIRELENTAAYYKLLGVLPDNLTQANAKNTPSNLISKSDNNAFGDINNIEDIILNIIAESSKQGYGIGRVAICNKLSYQGHPIGEGKVKSILKELQNKGYVESSLGRGGCRITQLGFEYINN